MKKDGFISYLKSKEFRNQLKIALALVFAIVFLISILLYFFTRHNSHLTVPDFSSLTIEEATELADDNNMRLSVMDSVFQQDLRPGTVVDQEPKAGSEVKKNRRIFLVMNAISPEMIKMPDIVGVSLRQALAILESSGLQPGRLKYVPDIATNNVLKQRFEGKDIKSGMKIKKGSHIDMVLGNSGSGPVDMPDLKGLSLRQAERKLAQFCLNIGVVQYDTSVVTDVDSVKALVIKQNPTLKHSPSIQMGSLVDVWLALPQVGKVQTEEDDNE